MFSKKGLSQYVSLCLICSNEYGYSSTDIKDYLERKFNVKSETIYPMLRKLYNDELVEFRWSETTNSPRKEYKIKKEGINYIKQNSKGLKEVVRITNLTKLGVLDE